MNRTNGVFWKIISFVVLVFITVTAARASGIRTQNISLHKGWNAIFLEVSPTNASPAAVFASTPVSIAGVYFGGDTSVQYIQNPGNISWKRDGWAVWYAPSRQDDFLSTLFAIQGNRGYLIYAESDFMWTVTGTVALGTVKWKPDSFNYGGFGVNAAAAPTFGRYFAGSTAHQPGKIYRLVNDQWTLVANPATEQMRAGESCWVYCKGASDYQGPLSVKVATGDSVLFGSSAESPVTLENRTGDPLTVKVETVAQDSGLPLAYVVRGISTNALNAATFDLPALHTLPALEAKQVSYLWLKLRREKMSNATQTALLKISTDSGAEVWLPVTGTVAP